jgi:hypothetical protein
LYAAHVILDLPKDEIRVTLNNDQAPARQKQTLGYLGGTTMQTRRAWNEAFWAVALIGGCLAMGYGAMAVISERALVIASLQ